MCQGPVSFAAAGLRLYWTQFGQVWSNIPLSCKFLTFSPLVESDLLSDRFKVHPSPYPSELLCSLLIYHSGKKSVLRKKPAGQLLSSTAHQVEREYRILNALHKHNAHLGISPEKRVPVPQPYTLCEDSTVIGTPFYVMEFLDGRIFTDIYMPQLDPKDRREW